MAEPRVRAGRLQKHPSGNGLPGPAGPLVRRPAALRLRPDVREPPERRASLPDPSGSTGAQGDRPAQRPEPRLAPRGVQPGGRIHPQDRGLDGELRQHENGDRDQSPRSGGSRAPQGSAPGVRNGRQGQGGVQEHRQAVQFGRNPLAQRRVGVETRRGPVDPDQPGLQGTRSLELQDRGQVPPAHLRRRPVAAQVRQGSGPLQPAGGLDRGSDPRARRRHRRTVGGRAGGDHAARV